MQKVKISPRLGWSLLSIAILFIFQAFGYPVSAAELSTGGLLLAGIGDLDVKGINDLLEKQGRAFEEFKSANDKRLEAVEKKGYAPADTVEKVETINAELTRLSKEIGELMKKSNRRNMGGSDNELSQEQAEHKSAFADYFRKGRVDNLRELEQKALNTGSDPDGGYLVPTEIETMIDRVASAEVAMRRLATVRAIGAASYKKPVVTTGAAGGWLGETEEAAETTPPKLSELEFTPGKLYAYPWATNDMLEDGVIDIEQWLTQEVEEIFVEKEGEAFITGSGIKNPKGILAYTPVANANHTWGKLGYIASGASGAFHTDEGDALINLVHALKRKYRNGASWLMNDLTMAGVRKIKDGDENYIWRPGLEVGVSDTLLGYPVEIDDYMPDIGVDSYSIAFGNFKRGYLIVDRRGVAVIRDQLTKPGYTKLNVSKRVGGGVQNFEAIKLMKFASS
jgi:HK97 family phage major capsid protein